MNLITPNIEPVINILPPDEILPEPTEDEITSDDVLKSKQFLDYIGKIKKINEFKISLSLDLTTNIKTEPTEDEITQTNKDFEFYKNKFRALKLADIVRNDIQAYNIRKIQKTHIL